jgi:AcrR family transcriptional regulator
MCESWLNAVSCDRPVRRPAVKSIPEQAFAALQDTSAASKRRGRYNSPLMLERRQKVIEAAKELIAEAGEEGFMIRALTLKTGASNTFIYSAFGDKEGVMAAAIVDFHNNLPYTNKLAPSSLTAILREMTVASNTIIANPSYSRAVTDMYFSRTAGFRIHEVLRNVAFHPVGPWLRRTMDAGCTIKGLAFEDIGDRLTTDRWSVVFDWARGAIPDDRLADRMRLSFLVTAAGLTTGGVRARIDATLAALLARGAP